MKHPRRFSRATQAVRETGPISRCSSRAEKRKQAARIAIALRADTQTHFEESVTELGSNGAGLWRIVLEPVRPKELDAVAETMQTARESGQQNMIPQKRRG
jgi:hypothetical protein